MLIIKSRSFFNLKFDILKGQRIGQIKVPFTRLLGSSQFGDIYMNIGNEDYNIRVPLKGAQRIGYGVSGYKLVKGDSELAEVTFPPRGAKEPLFLNWAGNLITFKNIGERTQVYLNEKEVGGFFEKGALKKEAILEIQNEIPIEIQVFIYYIYLQYSLLT